MSEPKLLVLIDGLRCRGWSLWWRFGFTPVVAVVSRLPIAEWRKEAVCQRIDFAAMDLHKRLHRP